MKNNEENIEPLSRKTILLINISLVLISILFIVSVANVIRYKKQKTEQQKVLLLQQKEVLKSLKTRFPDYRNSQDYKEKRMEEIPKVSIDEVQEGGATITINYSVPPAQPGYTLPLDYDLGLGCQFMTRYPSIDVVTSGFSPAWEIANQVSYVGDSDNKNGWDASFTFSGGNYPTYCYTEPEDNYEDIYLTGFPSQLTASATISIPSEAIAGTYFVNQWIGFNSGSEQGVRPEDYLNYTFKITPPCPVGVELTVTPQGG